MTTHVKLFCLLATVAMAAAATAQTPAASPPAGSYEEFVQKAKHPTDWLSWGADFRARNEYMNNNLSLSQDGPRNEQDVVRFRARLWASATVVTNVSLNARLSAEPREWIKPSFASQYRGQTGMEWRYGILDNLNAQWKYALDQPLNITAGRQDILIGDYYDWWLLADGTPGDGSWSFFLDAARVQYELKNIATKFDLIYIYQNPEADAWLPTIDRSDAYPLTEQREQGAVLYASNKSIENMQLDGYFIYKGDNQQYAGRGDNADIYTVGAKITGTPVEHIQYSLEGAYQFGWKEDPTIRGDLQSRELNAYGGKAKATYLFKDKMNNQLSLLGELLSGDDPDTEGTDEMFDVLWGRWPRWSELYIYSYVGETGGRIAQLNNIVRFGPSWSITPIKNTTFTAMYNALYALESVPTRALPTYSTYFSNEGYFRGHYLQAILKHQFTKQVSAHLWGEFVWEGDYYAQRDLMTFLRAEVLLTF